MEETMKRSKFMASVFGVIGCCAVAAGIYLSFNFMHASPMLVRQPQAAVRQAEAMLDAVCNENMAAAGKLLYGTPSLGADRDPADQVGNLLWDAFIDSMEYELGGECYATDSGVAMDVKITALDLNSVTATLKDRSTVLLEQRVAAARDADDVYDENGDYREDFVMQVLYDAATAALAEDSRTVTKEVTMSLVYDDGQWWIMPESALMDAISGGILK
jgi:hypothetical protein